MLELQDLLYIAIIFGAGGYWWKARETKELAYQAIRAHCEKVDVSLLDDSLVLQSVKLKTPTGKWGISRHYQFEFTTTGEYRYNGKIIMVGNRVSEIRLSPHHVS